MNIIWILWLLFRITEALSTWDLMWKPKKVQREGVILSLAMNYNLNSHKTFVGTLRQTGFKGNIILGVEEQMKPNVKNYLNQMNVTMKTVTLGPCQSSDLEKSDSTYWIRHKCSFDFPQFKIEWARYALALKWLQNCTECQGWVLVCDYRDTFFQEHPFREVNPNANLYLVEEYLYKTTHWFTSVPLKRCYHDKHLATFGQPMLCSGTTYGTIPGITRYLSTIVREYNRLVDLPECLNVPDQAVHNWLYYHGHFGKNTAIDRFQKVDAIVQTVGTPCSEKKKRLKQQGMSRKEMMKPGIWEKDNQILIIDPKYGHFLNEDHQRAAIIHQWDRCNRWMKPVIETLFLPMKNFTCC